MFRPSGAGKQPVVTRRSDAEAQRGSEPNQGRINDSSGTLEEVFWLAVARGLGASPRRSFQILGMWRAGGTNRHGEEERSRLGFRHLFTDTAGSW